MNSDGDWARRTYCRFWIAKNLAFSASCFNIKMRAWILWLQKTRMIDHNPLSLWGGGGRNQKLFFKQPNAAFVSNGSENSDMSEFVKRQLSVNCRYPFPFVISGALNIVLMCCLHFWESCEKACYSVKPFQLVQLFLYKIIFQVRWMKDLLVRRKERSVLLLISESILRHE